MLRSATYIYAQIYYGETKQKSTTLVLSYKVDTKVSLGRFQQEGILVEIFRGINWITYTWVHGVPEI